MPELPEVEAARRALEDHCVGKRILKCTAADDTKVIDGVSRADFESSLPGKSIVSIHRKGKNLWIRLDSPPFPSFQFGMTGSFYIKGVAVTKYKRSAVSESEEWPSKFSKVFLVLDDGLEVSFTDKRRFAKVRLLDDPESAPPISVLGPDALYEPMQVDELAGLLSKKKIPIKALLLDQGCISGIGNWVADEVLYQARIHPEQTAATLSKESCESLHKAIKEVIQHAVSVDADSRRFPIEWLFHFRWGKKSGKVNGKKIEFIIAGGRTTAYVPELQKLSGNATVKSATARSKKPKKNNGGKDGSDSEKERDEAQTAKKGSKKSRKDGEDKPKKPEKVTTKKLAKAEEGPSKKRAKPNKACHDDADEDERQIPEKGTGKKQTKFEEGPSKKRAKPGKAIIDDVDKDEPQNPEEGTEKKHAKAEKEPSKKITKPNKASCDDVDEDEPQNSVKGIGQKQAKAEGPSKKIAKPSKASRDDVDKNEPQKPQKDTGKKQAKAEEEPSKKNAKSSKASRDDGVEDEPQKPGKGTTKKQEKAEEEPSKKRGKPTKAEEEPSKKRGKSSKAGVQQKK